MIASTIIIGTISGAGLCYHLMRAAHGRRPFDAPMVIFYTTIIYACALLLESK